MFSPEETWSSDDSLGNLSETIPSFGNAIFGVRYSLEAWKIEP